MVRGDQFEPTHGLPNPSLAMQARLTTAFENDLLPPELLQIAALTQEALILLNVETARFKTSSVVKVHKLSAVRRSLYAEEEKLMFVVSVGAKLQRDQGEGCRCHPKDVYRYRQESSRRWKQREQTGVY